MVTSKIFGSVLATALAVGVVTTGWSLAGGAIALAQRNGGKQPSNDAIVIQANQATGVANVANPNLNIVTSGPAVQQNSVLPKYRDIGYYSADELTPSEIHMAQQLRETVDLQVVDMTLWDICEMPTRSKSLSTNQRLKPKASIPRPNRSQWRLPESRFETLWICNWRNTSLRQLCTRKSC